MVRLQLHLDTGIRGWDLHTVPRLIITDTNSCMFSTVHFRFRSAFFRRCVKSMPHKEGLKTLCQRHMSWSSRQGKCCLPNNPLWHYNISTFHLHSLLRSQSLEYSSIAFLGCFDGNLAGDFPPVFLRAVCLVRAMLWSTPHDCTVIDLINFQTSLVFIPRQRSHDQ